VAKWQHKSSVPSSNPPQCPAQHARGHTGKPRILEATAQTAKLRQEIQTTEDNEKQAFQAGIANLQGV